MGYYRKVEENRRLKKLYDETWHSYGSGAYWDDKRGVYRKYWPYSKNHGCNLRKYYHRANNKRVRRLGNRGEVFRRSVYKKVFDLWWTLY